MMPGLGEDQWDRVSLARCSRRIEGEVARTRPHREIFRRHSLEVMVEDVGLCRNHPLNRARSCAENRA